MAIVVVDGFSTGAYLVQHIRALLPNERIFHVQSSNELPAALTGSFSRAPFTEDLGIFDGAEPLRARLGETPQHVIAGADPGVQLAEELALTFECASANQAKPAGARYDKSKMHELIPATWAMRTEVARSNEEVASALATFGANSRYVVKPPRSSATDGVRRCETADEAREHAKYLFRLGRDLFGNPIDRVLIQKQFEGDEFCVNAVSVRGAHFFTDVWRYTKKPVVVPEAVRDRHGEHFGGMAPIYDFDELIEPAALIGASLLACASEVLTGVGIAYGPSHTEIIVEHEKQPDKRTVLVETTPRLQGCIDRAAFAAAVGFDPTYLAALAYVDPGALVALPWISVDDFKMLDVSMSLRRVHLIAPKAGRFKAAALKEWLEALPTYWADSYRHRLGEDAWSDGTYDLMSSPGFFFLAGETASVEADYIRLRDVEKEFFV